MIRTPVIVPIVEGDGEVGSVPVLLRRVLGERHERHDIHIQRPINSHGVGSIRKNIDRFLGYARKYAECDAVLVFLDSDGDCPCSLAADLARSAKELNMDVPVAIVCAHHMYESWFIASLDSPSGEKIRGKLDLSENAEYEGDVESINSPKAWLKDHISRRDRSYSETKHQAALTDLIDIEHTQHRSRSFRRFCHAVEELVGGIGSGEAAVTPLAPKENTIGGTNHD